MIGKILNSFRGKRSLARLFSSPIVQRGQKAISECWTSRHELTKDFSSQFVSDIEAEMFQEVINVATAADPRMANRERIFTYVSEFSQLQVLVIDPHPLSDQSGVRGVCGVSG